MGVKNQNKITTDLEAKQVNIYLDKVNHQHVNISIPGAESGDMTPLAATETGRLRGTWTIPEIGGPAEGRLRGRRNIRL